MIYVGTRPNTESACIDSVVFTWAPLVPATHHSSHAEPHALVLVHHVSKQLGRRCHRDALLVAQLVDAALAGQQTFPEAAVGGPSSHCAQQIGVDLNHLLHRLRGDVRACCGPRVHRYNNSMLELWGSTAREGKDAKSLIWPVVYFLFLRGENPLESFYFIA